MNNSEYVYDTSIVVENAVPVIENQEPVFEPYKIVQESDPILTTRTDDFDFSNPDIDPVDIASRLVETAILHDAFTLAANQCGLNYNLFVAGSGEDYVAFFNPEILYYSEETVVLPENDLSNMGIQLNINRPKDISVQYIDYTGETKVVNFSGLTSRVIQQSIDRLHGIDFKTKVSKFVADRAKASLDKKIKKFVKRNVRFG